MFSIWKIYVRKPLLETLCGALNFSKNRNLDSHFGPHGLPRASKIDPGAFKIIVFDLPGSVYDSGDDFWGENNDFVSHFGGLGTKIQKNRVWKLTRFLHWFFHGLGMVLERFFYVFLMLFWASFENAVFTKNIVFLGSNHYFSSAEPPNITPKTN